MPKMPPRACTHPGCGKYAVKNGKCEEHYVPWDHGGKSSNERGYGHKWRQLRKFVLERDEHMCQECLRNGRYTLGNQVDHIVNKADGGTDRLSNLEVLCQSCHEKKTKSESIRGRK